MVVPLLDEALELLLATEELLLAVELPVALVVDPPPPALEDALVPEELVAVAAGDPELPLAEPPVLVLAAWVPVLVAPVRPALVAPAPPARRRGRPCWGGYRRRRGSRPARQS